MDFHRTHAGVCRGGTREHPSIVQSAAPAESLNVWGVKPLSVSVNYRQENDPRIIFEIWNKGDAFKPQVDAPRAYRKFKERLEAIQREFRVNRKAPEDPAAANSIFVPGHACLLIGIHPETREIVFSDTWGLVHAYKVAS